MNRIDEIRQRSEGITAYMRDANKAEIHRRDCIALLSIIDQHELKSELHEQVMDEKKRNEEALAKKEGIKVDEIFIDTGFSGLNEQRPSYLKLLETAKQGDTIIMSDPSKLTRNQNKMSELSEKYKFLLP